MALLGTSKWKDFGQVLARELSTLAGANLENLKAGINAGLAAENARSGTGQMAPPAKRGPGRAKKQPAIAAT